MALLSIRNLGLEIVRPGSRVSVLHGVDLALDAGEILGLVGETGSGKTMTALSILRLLPTGARFTGGSIQLDGLELVGADDTVIRQVRGRKVGTIFQQPRAALSPTRPVVAQVADRYSDLLGLGRREAVERAYALLRDVGLPDPRTRGRQFPHQLSGGMCQRVMVALAIAAGPRLLLADEPTTGLDVTLQDQILRLIQGLAAAQRMGVLLITHDLAVVARICRRVAVMYAGAVVESGPTAQVLQSPQHPYTAGLVAAIAGLEQGTRPVTIPGVVPRFQTPPDACPFVARCSRAFAPCRLHKPGMAPVGPEHSAACHLYTAPEAAYARTG